MADRDKELSHPKKKSSAKGGRFAIGESSVSLPHNTTVDLTCNIVGGSVPAIVSTQDNRIIRYAHPPPPITPTFPITAAGFAVTVSNPVCVPSFIWGCQEGSGNLIDLVASEPLVPAGGVIFSQPTDFVDERVAVGNIGGTDHFANDDATVMDSSGSSFALVLAIRQSGSAPDNTRGFAGKHASSTTSGWMLRTLNDAFEFRVHDGTSTLNAVHLGNVWDGGWFGIAAVYNFTTEFIHVYATNGSAVSTDVGALMQNFTNANFLRIFDQAGASASSTDLRIANAVGLTGTAAEAFTQTELDALWVGLL